MHGQFAGVGMNSWYESMRRVGTKWETKFVHRYQPVGMGRVVTKLKTQLKRRYRYQSVGTRWGRANCEIRYQPTSYQLIASMIWNAV